MYKADKSDTRFDKIYRQLAQVEDSQKRDSLFVKDQSRVLDAKLADDRFIFEAEIRKL